MSLTIRRTSVRVVAVMAAAITLVGLCGPAASASVSSSAGASTAQPAKTRPHYGSAGITSVLPSPRVDQDTTTTVTIRGASSASPVSVTWGDATRASGVRVGCSVKAAVRHPDSCTARFTHAYSRAGTFTIRVRDGRRVVARTTLVVRALPLPWSEPTGWVQPAGWASYGSATYTPCSTVLWYYGRATEPPAGSTMHADVVAGLAMLAAQTGLALVETADPAKAKLKISWADIEADYPGASAYGGQRGDRGFVVISQTDWWPTDAWAGFGIVTQPDGSSSVGRGWLIVHETMHALGLDHVDDETSIMNPMAGATAFNAGDLDGLHTMYLNNPCPA